MLPCIEHEGLPVLTPCALCAGVQPPGVPQAGPGRLWFPQILTLAEVVGAVYRAHAQVPGVGSGTAICGQADKRLSGCGSIKWQLVGCNLTASLNRQMTTGCLSNCQGEAGM
jgi:hypothetical protein